jgi:UDP-N-acetylmuramate--alanine ligase
VKDRNEVEMNPEFQLQPDMHIHLVGIGGAGLSAIARVLLGRGFTVSGSDLQSNQWTADLAAAGATIYEGHRADQCPNADLLLISSAIPENNPEIVAARATGKPVLKRAEFLGALMAGSHGIAIAGSHGKTTTTGMIAQILIDAGLDPSIIVGGDLPLLGANGRAGQSDYFLIEADEYDHMFLGLRPKVAVITNIEYDHPDLYLTAADYLEAFRQFARQLPPGGRLVLCSDDPQAAALAQDSLLPAIVIETYGLNPASWQAVDIRPNQLGGSDFLVQHGQTTAGLVRIRVPGRHNVRNALAAIAVAAGLGVEFGAIRAALAAFGGIGRRFQVIGQAGDVTIIDDYAHHPTEIQATLAAARELYPGRPIWAVWQPHTYSRTKRLLAGFTESFDLADRLVALDIFPSRETETLGIDTTIVLKAIDHPKAYYARSMDDASTYILERVRPGDIILTLTAGDGYLVGQFVLQSLTKRTTNGDRGNR